MLRVEIILNGNCYDHTGDNMINKLVFSKEYHKGYVHGHYPLASFGSLYRNVDDFRESPFQSRTDFEIRFPSLYTSPDGSFQTVDLLYHLEDVNEKKGLEFNLIGCRAILSDDEAEVYAGMVESFANSGGTTSLRISDWLGSPKIARSEFPIIIGEAESFKWQAKVTLEEGIAFLELGDMPFESEPDLFLKTEDKDCPYVKIESFCRISYGNKINIEYSNDYRRGVLCNYEAGSQAETIHEDVGRDQDIFLKPTYSGSYFPRFGDDAAEIAGTGKPIRYGVGKGENFEILDNWVNGLAFGTPVYMSEYPLGRSEHPDRRRPHSKGEAIVRLDKNPIFVSVSVRLFVESMLANQAGRGNPSQLVKNSRENKSDPAFCPYFSGWSLSFLVYLSDGGLPSTAVTAQTGTGKILEHRLKLHIALKGSDPGINLILWVYSSDSLTYDQYSIKADGNIQTFDLDYIKHKSLETVRRLVFRCMSLSSSNVKETISVCHVSVTGTFIVPFDNTKIYVSGGIEKSYYDDSSDTTVKNAVRNTLGAAGINEVPVSGSCNRLLYSYAINSEAVAVRDMLRSLAAESATLINFSPKEKEVRVRDISLQNEQTFVFIPLSVFVLENNIYSFSLESPDRSELLRSVAVYWGKDIDSGKYEHVFSATATLGITMDGEQMEIGRGHISAEKWGLVLNRMKRNSAFGVDKTVETKWITDWKGAENYAYNLLRWNAAPMRRAQAECIFTELNKLNNPDGVDIGTFVSFSLPGYPQKFTQTAWVVTGRHDNLDTMVSTLELLETRDLPVPQLGDYLLLENRRNLFFENAEKIKLEEFYG